MSNQLYGTLGQEKSVPLARRMLALLGVLALVFAILASTINSPGAIAEESDGDPVRQGEAGQLEPEAPVTVDVAETALDGEDADINTADIPSNEEATDSAAGLGDAGDLDDSEQLVPYGLDLESLPPVAALTEYEALGDIQPLQCGKKVALVIDLSGSIRQVDGVDQMQQLKEAATTVVNNFAGSATELGIYNFSTTSPAEGRSAAEITEAITMSESRNVERAKNVIKALGARGEGATNWAAGLERVEGEGYDTVLFLTDGVPNLPAVSPDTDQNAGYVDYDAAVAAREIADRLKNNSSGKPTRLVGVFIGDNKPSEGFKAVCTRLWQYNQTCRTISHRNNGEGGVNTGRYVPYMSESEAIQGFTAKPVVIWRDSSGNPIKVRNASSRDIANSSSCDFRTYRYGYGYDEVDGLRYLYSCPIKGGYYDDYYLASELSAKPFNLLQGVATDGSIVRVNDFTSLKSELNELTDTCKGTVSIQKRVVDSNGIDISMPGTDGNLAGFEFTASQSVVNDQMVSGEKYSTDSDGLAQIVVGSSSNSLPGGQTTLIETKKDNYTLFKQGGENAVCRAFDSSGNVVDGSVSSESVEDSGFSVKGVKSDYKIFCTVKNQYVEQNPNFEIKKDAVKASKVITGNKGDTFSADYTVTLTNSGNGAGVPPSISENPSPPNFLAVSRVTARTDSGLFTGARELVKGDDGWTLDNSGFASIDPAGSVEIKVTVYYEIKRDISGGEDALQCSSDGKEHGLYNSASLKTDAAQGDDACTSLDIAKLNVKKKVNTAVLERGADAETKNDAVEIPGSGEYSIEFFIQNVGTVPLNSAKLSDVLLQDEDTPVNPEQKIDLVGMECFGRDVEGVTFGDDGHTATVDFSPALPKGRDVKCAIGFNAGDQSFIDGFRGDRVTATGYYPDPDGDGNQPTGPVTDDAWVKASASVDYWKFMEQPDTPRVVSGVADQTFPVTYYVALRNSGSLPGTLSAIVDTPKPASGLEIDSVTVSNAPETIVGEQLPDGLKKWMEPLKNGPIDLSPNSGTYDTWVIGEDQLNRIPARSLGVLKLTAMYRVATPKENQPADYTCTKQRGGEEGRGLYNEVVVTGASVKDGDDSNGNICASLNRGELVVDKKIDGANPSERGSAETADGDTVKIGYTLSNSGQAPIKKIDLVDYFLDASDQNTDSEMAISELSCSQDAKNSVNGSTVVFEDALAPGQSVTCEWEAAITELEQHLHQSIHGDEVSATPFFEQPEDQGGGLTEGTPAKDKAWVGIPGEFTLKKNTNDNERIVSGQDGQEITVTYLISVSNTGHVAAVPQSIIDNPLPAEGIEVVTLSAKNNDEGVSLLKSSDSVPFKQNNGEYVLTRDQFNAVPGETTATIRVTAKYRVAKPDNFVATSDSLACSGDNGGPGKGLYNEARLEGGEPDDACIDLLVPQIGLKKLINGEDANDQETAVAVIEGTDTVTVTYEITNEGSVTFDQFSVKDLLSGPSEPAAIQEAAITIDVASFTCDKPVTVDGNGASGVTIRLEGRGTLEQGESMSCSWSMSNDQKTMNYSEAGYHKNRATVSASYDSPALGAATPNVSASDDAWASKIPTLAGKLPYSGGNGIGIYWLAALSLFGLGILIRRRERKA